MAIALAATAPVLLAQASPAADPRGVWVRDDGGSRVRISQCGANLCAVNLWIRDPASGEAAGDVLVLNVAPEGPKLLAGTAFDRKRNLTYRMELTVEQASLRTQGCVAAGLLCREARWSRAR